MIGFWQRCTSALTWTIHQVCASIPDSISMLQSRTREKVEPGTLFERCLGPCIVTRMPYFTQRACTSGMKYLTGLGYPDLEKSKKYALNHTRILFVVWGMYSLFRYFITLQISTFQMPQKQPLLNLGEDLYPPLLGCMGFGISALRRTSESCNKNMGGPTKDQRSSRGLLAPPLDLEKNLTHSNFRNPFHIPYKIRCTTCTNPIGSQRRIMKT